jgi:hypothetical protein
LPIQRHGAPVCLKSFGTIDTKASEPMNPEAIFRIHSMSSSPRIFKSVFARKQKDRP